MVGHLEYATMLIFERNLPLVHSAYIVPLRAFRGMIRSIPHFTVSLFTGTPGPNSAVNNATAPLEYFRIGSRLSPPNWGTGWYEYRYHDAEMPPKSIGRKSGTNLNLGGIIKLSTRTPLSFDIRSSNDKKSNPFRRCNGHREEDKGWKSILLPSIAPCFRVHYPETLLDLRVTLKNGL
jgi:hypothetical protein